MDWCTLNVAKKPTACLAFPRIRDGRECVFPDAFEGEELPEWGGSEVNKRIADPATVSEDGRSSDLVTRSILIIACGWGGGERQK